METKTADKAKSTNAENELLPQVDRGPRCFLCNRLLTPKAAKDTCKSCNRPYQI